MQHKVTGSDKKYLIEVGTRTRWLILFVLVTSMRRIKGTDRNRALSKATFAANKTGSEQRSCAADPVQRAVTCGHLKLAMGADTEPRGWRLSKTQRTAICSG